MVSLPTNIATQFNQGKEKVVAGATSVACLLYDVPKPATASETPGHGLGLKNASKELSPTSDTRSLNLKGGVTAVAAVKTITFSNVAVADETVTAGTKVYTFKASPAGADEVAHGSTATDSAQNLKAKINTDTADTKCTATGDAAVLTLTANTPGTDFDLSETSTVATTAVLTANVVGVKASILITLEGSRFLNVLETIGFDVTANSKTRRITCYNKVASASSGSITKNSSAAGTALAGLLLSLQNCINGEASDTTNFYDSSNFQDEQTDCTAFAVQLFGTDSSFTVTGNQLKIEAGATGADGNNIKIHTSVRPSAPSQLPDIISSGLPQFDEGEVVHSGIFDETKLSNALQELLFKGSNAFGNILSITGDIDDSFSIKLFINNDPDFAAKLLRNGAVTRDEKRLIFLSTNDLSNRTTGLFLAIKSKTKKGAWNCLWIYDAEITGTVDTAFGLRDTAGYTINVRINQDLERSGDPKFVRWNALAL